ncbi:GNAT family N-acetyltransferase [Spirilliplanes yamanashiensis]|uniref:GNAT family N-acetyltransferase n=1 Tax=Spirilliplanes yamanashiensis TaxID=42233 RepID=A0A8J3Y5I3_9ACTN|nr:GNAT family protein [Spirilliplanes yamanashiensis]MDP9819435.1 aminoglycoside 6'-N-acetyltransferase [Spirilliplanes yamanashiensis]GIJ01742.1 GNAT family N-acetyltransferase [Spirilliplanes yamanashiensis]
MTLLHGDLVLLRTAVEADIPALVRIRSTAAVLGRWPLADESLEAELAADVAGQDGVEFLAVVVGGAVVGAVQWAAEDDPMYRHAGIDIYLDPAVHGRGIGTDAVRTLARHLVRELGHHRLVIDPAADNEPAIRCYAKVGFKPVGVMRQYERAEDGTWHDGLLMDLLADELT